VAFPISDTTSTLYSAEFLDAKYKLRAFVGITFWRFVGVAHFYERELYW
jgi:hypothetical protein